MWGATARRWSLAAGVLLVVARVARDPAAAAGGPGAALRPRPAPGSARSRAPRASSSPTPRPPACSGRCCGPRPTAVERVLGGAASVRRRLERAGIDKTVARVPGRAGASGGWSAFAVAAASALLAALAGSGGAVSLAAALRASRFALGVICCATTSSPARCATRERRILAEFPTVAELLALAVAAGEGPVAALDRVVRRSGGELSARPRPGAGRGPHRRAGRRAPSTSWRRRTGLPLVARFAQGIAVAVERGTPLADVLHAQAADVREAGRRELIERAPARRS